MPHDTAVFINHLAAARFIAGLADTMRRAAETRPIYARHALRGWAVAINGRIVTEREV